MFVLSRCLVVVCLVLLLSMSGTGVRAASPSGPVVAVRVTAEDHAFDGTLARAKAVASEVFQRAGIHLAWLEQGPVEFDRVFTLTLAPPRARRPAPNPDVLGMTLDPGDGTRATIAHVFSTRVAAFADAHRLPRTIVLGCVIAHELGHLLLPANAHVDRGIMRAAWHPSLFPPFSAGLPGFLPEQVRALHSRLDRPGWPEPPSVLLADGHR